MLTRDIEMYKVAIACQKKTSRGFAPSQQQTQEAVSNQTAFLVYALTYPLINDTACVFDGVIPTLSLLPEVAKSNIHAVFVFSQNQKWTSKIYSKQQEVYMTNTAGASKAPIPSETYYLTSFKNPNSTMSITIKHQFDNAQWRFVDFAAGITFLINPQTDSISFTQQQHDKAMEIISMELKKFVQDKFSFNHSYTTKNNFNIKDNNMMTTELTKVNTISSMTTVEIAAQTGKEHRNVKRDAETMLTELYGKSALLRFEQSYFADNGQEYTCYALSKNDVLTLVSGYSIPLRAKIIRRLDELENQKNGYNNIPNDKKESFELELIGIKYVSEMLRCSEVSKLQLAHAVYKNNGVSTHALPQYVNNQRVQFAAKDLLLKNNIKMSPQSFNKLLIVAGLLEDKERSSKSSPTGKKKFKALTQAGLQYGTNEIFPNNPNETQPRYYEDTFMELFNLVSNKE